MALLSHIFRFALFEVRSLLHLMRGCPLRQAEPEPATVWAPARGRQGTNFLPRWSPAGGLVA